MMPNHPAIQETKPKQNWIEILEEHDVQYLILDTRGDNELLRLFQSQPNWKIDFQDKETIIMARAGTA